MHPPQINDIISLTIHSMGSNGEGIGSYEGYTVFVEGALPTELVEARLFLCQKRYGRAHLLSIKTPSPDRATPPCPLFGKCGGCQIMHLSYEKQLLIKQQKVIDALQRIGKLTNVSVQPCLPSPSSLGYRNKIQLPVRMGEEGISLGLYAQGSHDLIEMDTCYIHCPLGETVYQAICPIIKQSTITAFDPVTNKGELRHVLIKSAVHTQEVLVILVTTEAATPLLRKIAQTIMEQCPAVKGVVHNFHPQNNNTILGHTYHTLEGVGFIKERLCDLLFKVSPASFFQVNPDQAELLYNKALELAHLQGTETVLDAYCGVGTLSLFFAKRAKKVIGVESVPEAIQDAKENALLNNISNVHFVCDNSEIFINKSIKEPIDLILLNPPRKGCEPTFLKGIERLKPKKLIYISCDPATLARDLSYLCACGYQVDAVQPYDMFPQTAHVETVVALSMIP